MKKTLPFILVGLLSGCVGQGQKATPPSIDQHARFSVPIKSAAISTEAWWKNAVDDKTGKQLRHLLNVNLTMQTAASEVIEESADLDQADAARYFTIDLSGQVSATRNDGVDTNRQALGINASLPLDIFGRLALSRDAAHFDLVAAIANLEDARLQTVQRYLLNLIDGSETRQRQRLLNEQISTAQTQLRLTEFRFAQGIASSVDILQQREQLASLQQQLPGVTLQLRSLSNSKSQLLAMPPTSVVSYPDQLLQIKTNYSTHTPAQLLKHRPDLIAQSATLAASDQRYEAVLRERIADISLDSSVIAQIATGNPAAILNAAINISVNLFDHGQLEAKINEQNALLKQAGIDYLQAWLAAVVETDNLLNQQQINSHQLELSEKLNIINNDLFTAAQERYKRGVSDYLPVLSSLRSLHLQQRNHLALQASQQRIRIRLHTAFGLPSNASKNVAGEKP